MHSLTLQPLTAAAFSPFGEVIETAGHTPLIINSGSTERYHQLANIQLDNQGDAIISIFRAQALKMPLTSRMLEKHPLGSQAFFPLQQQAFIIVVAPKSDRIEPERLQAFISDGSQGVNYHRNIWHHPVIALHDNNEFLVVDRSGPGNNCDEYFFLDNELILLSP